MKYLFVLFLFGFSNLVFSQDKNNVLQSNFIQAMNTLNDIFIIINVKDLNTNEIKEVCLTNEDLRTATKLEKSITYDEAFELLQKSKSRDFEFKNKEALEMIFYNYYPEKYLLNNKLQISINKIISDFKENKNKTFAFDDLKGSEYLYGYLLSKEGLLIGVDYQCFGFQGIWCVSCQKE